MYLKKQQQNEIFKMALMQLIKTDNAPDNGNEEYSEWGECNASYQSYFNVIMCLGLMPDYVQYIKENRDRLEREYLGAF